MRATCNMDLSSETSEYFQLKVYHFSLEQMKTLKHNNQLVVNPPHDIGRYIREISSKCGRDSVTLIAELMHQSEKHTITFSDAQYTTPGGSIRFVMIETYVFIFRREQRDDGTYFFNPKKGTIDLQTDL